ncbi:MATE family efflux transporter [Sulfurimonas sp.]|uniref:MATE family efflux transporter n=1 Tax=Sulfurimonas sp. TaxID=2022749 RepID=UPI002B48105F|nr:MATE family efflux transporter [Sulfurimonas sp.]
MHIDLTQGVIKEHIVKLAVPAVIGYFFHTMFNVTDTIFAGMISTQALAALSLSASIFFMVLAIGIGMSEAVTSIIGNALGKKDIAKAQQVLLNSLVFAVFLSIVLALVGIFSVPYLIDALGDSSYTKETLEYINIILYGSIFFVGSFFLNAILTATGDTISFRNILIFTAFLNIFLDYIFIKVFNLSVSAIALATVISEAITLIYLFYKVRKTKLWCGFSEFIFDINIMKELLKQGFPPSVNMFMMAFGMYIITYFVAPFGKEAVAAFGIGMRIEQIFLMPVIGINIAALAIISQNNGAKSYSRIPKTVKLSVRYGWIISTIGVSSFLLFANYFASFMSSDPLVIKEVALYLRVAGFASYGFVVIFVYIAMLQGIAKPAIIFPLSVFRQLIAPVVLFSILSIFNFGIFSMWLGLDIIIFSSALFLWFYGEKKLKQLR